MSFILAAGSDPNYYYSRAALATSTDSGVTWTKQAASSETHRHWTDYATDFVNQVALGNANNASYSSDGLTWGDYSFEAPQLELRRVIFTPYGFQAVGFRKNTSTRGEHAIAAGSQSGIDASSWALSYESGDSYSGLVDIASIGGTTFLAAGYQNQFKSPLLIRTSNFGSWDAITLPGNFDSPLHSIHCTATGLTLLGGVGWIARGQFSGNNTSWTKNTNLVVNNKPKAITHIIISTVSGKDVTLALSGSTVFWSVNGYDYQSVTQPGYTFRSIAFVPDQNQWILGVTSTLNQYTAFRATYTPDSPGSLSLTGLDCGVFPYQLFVV